MYLSIFDLFSVGLGPSSSHTVGPLRAGHDFVARLAATGDLPRVASLQVDVYGSLSATGHGHGTFPAILLGLEGWRVEKIGPDEAESRYAAWELGQPLALGAQLGDGPGVNVHFGVEDMIQHPLTVLPRHTNGMKLKAFSATGELLADDTYFSIGGGFIEREGDEHSNDFVQVDVPYPFDTSAELLQRCEETGLSISQVAMANECALRPVAEVEAGIDHLWDVMEGCKQSALTREGRLPGGLEVRRRAAEWHARLTELDVNRDFEYWQEWVNLTALAVNEENATGGRIVTAPTNGAAGIIPAVGFYATHYAHASRGKDEQTIRANVRKYLLTAAAVGNLYKKQASISGAEVGCQGEVGSASSMASAGLAEVLGGTPQQVENAAEIAIEHNLGLTCDPIGGLVQIPCIERNAIASTKAVNAARMAMMGDGDHRVSLDEVIITMRETGEDMLDKYKETARGGLAINGALTVNMVEC
ncbi:MAG: L-serine ammonia-lyase [Galactobacter sp.]